MPNEFEKIVQQKMDELNLVPSAPVWQKVELQIRKKKDRRRMIFWIPLLVLLLGGGLWIGVTQYSNKVVHAKEDETEKTNNKKPVQNSLTNNSKIIKKNAVNNANTITRKTIPGNTLQKEKTIEEYKTVKAGFTNKTIVQKDVVQKIGRPIEKIPISKKEIEPKPEETKLNKISKNEVVVNQFSIEKALNETIAKSDIVVHADSISITIRDNKDKVELTLSVPDSVRIDSTLLKDSIKNRDTANMKKAGVKKYASSKWKLNLVAISGSSDLTRLNFFAGEKSLMAAAPNYSGGSITGGGQLYYGPSDIKEGFSFAVGAVAKKQLAKKTFFSAGLRYNYYSNTIQVGNRINQNRIIMDLAVARYYTNYGTILQPYKNQYHFVSLPVAMDWQLLKKLPLNFHTGLSTQYLVKTNGLVFDYNTQSYFNSKEAFNRIQLFFESALTYSVSLKQKVLTFGPQLQYGLTRLEKNNSNYHLTSFGLKAQLQFGKK
jgi:hypothetical protein